MDNIIEAATGTSASAQTSESKADFVQATVRYLKQTAKKIIPNNDFLV